MKPQVALCLNGFQFGSSYYIKEIALSDKDGNLGLVYYVKLSNSAWKSLSTQEQQVYCWQSSNVFSFTWTYPEGTVPFQELQILFSHLEQLYCLYVECKEQQDLLLHKYNVHSAIIPAGTTLAKTGVYCGLPKHNCGFVCAYRREVLNAHILNQWFM